MQTYEKGHPNFPRSLPDLGQTGCRSGRAAQISHSPATIHLSPTGLWVEVDFNSPVQGAGFQYLTHTQLDISRQEQRPTLFTGLCFAGFF